MSASAHGVTRPPPILPTPIPHAPSITSLIAGFAVVYIIWGSTYLAIRYAIDSFPPLLMAGVRFTLAGTLLYAWMRMRGGADAPQTRHWRSAIIIGGLLLLGGNGLICMAELRVPSGMTALLVATVPLWMVLLQWLVFRGTRPTAIMFIGLACGLLGVFVLINPSSLLRDPIDPLGASAILVACLSWAIGSLYSREARLPKSVLLATAMEMIGGGVLLLIVGTIRGEWTSIHPDAISLKSILAFAYLVVFGSLIAFSAYVWLLKVASPAAVSTYAYVNPVVAVLLGTMLNNEPLGWGSALAAALIIAAVMLITMRRSPVKPVNQHALDASSGDVAAGDNAFARPGSSNGICPKLREPELCTDSQSS